MTMDLTEHATQTIQAGSKSFAAASRLLAPQTRRSAVMLYAWCRYCDDVIDGQQLGFTQAEARSASAPPRIAELQEAVWKAYAGEQMSIPAFAALQQVVLEHGIPISLPLEHLAGFNMDVEEKHYETIEDTLEYCYRVAGVVGIMMALLMGVEDEPTLDRACDLGLAFQLTNIARDIIEDAEIGRCYLPADWLRDMGIPRAEIADRKHRAALAGLASRLIETAEAYYVSARGGLSALPLRSAWAIATAHNVYREIGIKVKARGETAWDRRVSTSRLDKLHLLVRSLGMAFTSRHQQPSVRPSTLWQRPEAAFLTKAHGAPSAVDA